MQIQKVFGYIICQHEGRPQLLAFTSSDGPGFEIIRGHVELGESVDTAILREIEEESGLIDVRITKQMKVAYWENEEQTFFLCEAPGQYPATFSHVVTGAGGDEGVTFDFRWLELSEVLHTELLFGGDRLVTELLAHFGQKGATHL